ncbi:hypothetical protein [Paenirhodobacter populi]|uniref:Uncharacterized protein n=1 Tax=Paenirhodobacter populi TaxID=2306993 RepID=A0A443IZW5_9RHOB|nr:hypothetical protein [Sinirhodobacter populi]RWR11456.1 hypothetical protein D2T32_01200 [Sinirhodobacter populi]RWR13888.1 hypothetical protein D2T33_05700 [Sinirhodobacter populi]RWR17083.1 hypothetical protein D2T30_19950 [Sinirhodobacter populi]
MRLRLLALTTLATLCGCVETNETQGGGRASDGGAVSGTLETVPGSQVVSITLKSQAGWFCNATFLHADDEPQPAKAPLSCSDRRKGEIQVFLNRHTSQAAGFYRLSDGTTGQVNFGLF